MRELEALPSSFGLSVLVEVHDAIELELALQLATPLIGINNRNLRTFEVSLQNTIDLLSCMPPGKRWSPKAVSFAAADVAPMQQNGVHAFLVGEAFRASEPASRWRHCSARGKRKLREAGMRPSPAELAGNMRGAARRVR